MAFTGDKNDLCWSGREIFVGKVDSELSLKDDQNPKKWRERGALSPGPEASQGTVPVGQEWQAQPPPGGDEGTYMGGRDERVGVRLRGAVAPRNQLQPMSASQEMGLWLPDVEKNLNNL